MTDPTLPNADTDLGRFLALYRSFGIEIPLEEDFFAYQSPAVIYEAEFDLYTITLDAKSHPKLDGYMGFYTNVVFDKDGTFISQGFFE